MKCPVIAIVIPLLTEIALTTYKLSYVTLQCLVDSWHSLELYHMLFLLDKIWHTWHLAEMEQKIKKSITWGTFNDYLNKKKWGGGSNTEVLFTLWRFPDSHWWPMHKSSCRVSSKSATYWRQQSQFKWTEPVNLQPPRRMDHSKSSGNCRPEPMYLLGSYSE